MRKRVTFRTLFTTSAGPTESRRSEVTLPQDPLAALQRDLVMEPFTEPRFQSLY